jgi:hypothetical protein
MIIRKVIWVLLGATAVAAGTMPRAMAGSPYVEGDVFASVGNSTVKVFTPTGALAVSLNDASGAAFTTGSAFDASGNFYVTNFGSGTISKFDNSGNLVAPSFMSSNNTPESIVVAGTGPFTGSSFVGGPGAAVINQFNTSTGALIHSFSVAGGNDTGGTDWTELQSASSSNILYNGEGTKILSFNLATSTQNADFTSAATEAALNHIFAFRVVPSGAFAGDVLVANSIDAVMLNASGNIIKTYTLPGDLGTDFSLNLDPNGTDFWTGDAASGLMWEVNIATGAIDEQWNTGAAGTFFGVSVFGEETVVSATTPVPASLVLFGTGLFGGLGLLRRRRKAA